MMQVITNFIGGCAVTMLIWYVYLLMKGDKQA